jgi:hypothetical protein
MKNEHEIARRWEDWTPQSIKERREHLIEFARRRWYVDIPDDDEGVLQAPREDEEAPAVDAVASDSA